MNNYIVKINTLQINHEQDIKDKDDLEVLKAVLRKVERDATKAVELFDSIKTENQ